MSHLQVPRPAGGPADAAVAVDEPLPGGGGGVPARAGRRGLAGGADLRQRARRQRGAAAGALRAAARHLLTLQRRLRRELLQGILTGS